MPTIAVRFTETEITKLILEFLHNRGLNISMLSLEREAGVINGLFSDDLLFLRQLILDGQWDDVMDFVQPLCSIEAFNHKAFQYIINKHKFLELLCIKSESGYVQNYELTVDELVKCLNTLEQLCPSKEEYSNLCLLLTLPRLSDHAEYQNWNPSNARVECFKEVYHLVEMFLPLDKNDRRNEDRIAVSKSDRLVQLLIKGILYESCVDFCQHKATSSDLDSQDFKLASVLNGSSFGDMDLSLLSWLQAVPHDTFACPFEQKSLSVDIKPLEKPSLEASWSEQILVTPIKPKMFPHSAIPSLRPRGGDKMSMSLMPQYDGLAYGLSGSRRESLMNASADFSAGLMSKSFAGFHLNLGAKKSMQASVDKLFADGDMLDTQSSMLLEDTPLSSAKVNRRSPPPPGSHSPPVTPSSSSQLTSTPNQGKPTSATPARSGSPQHSISVGTPNNRSSKSSETSVQDSSSELYREYQRQKQRLQDELDAQDKKRKLYQQQLMEPDHKAGGEGDDDNRMIDSGKIQPTAKEKAYNKILEDRGLYINIYACTFTNFLLLVFTVFATYF